MNQAQVAGMDPERLASIPIRMKAFVEKGTIAGVVTLVARHGVMASLEAVGYQDLETKTLMRADTIFNIASMTKLVTAVGIMILLEEGRLALDDPVEKHLPEFKGISVSERREGEEEHALRPPSRAITIYDLLTHTSGVESGSPRTRVRAVGPGNERMLEFTLAEAVAYVAQFPLVFHPGTKYQYNNWGFCILGRIIEVVSGQPYEQFVEETIFRPLGMMDSFFFVPSDKGERIATVCTLEEGELKVRQGPGIYDLHRRKSPYPDGGILSTASDLFAFLQMTLNGGTYNGSRILSRASVGAMTEVHTGDRELAPTSGGESIKADKGLGWAVARRSQSLLSRRPVSIGSYGHPGGSGCFGWVDPGKDLVGIFLIARQVLDPVRPPEELDTFMAMAAAAIAD